MVPVDSLALADGALSAMAAHVMSVDGRAGPRGHRDAQRLLVIGAGPIRVAAFGTWRQLGLDVVLVDGHEQERYDELVAETYSFDARDSTADLESLRRIAKGCDGITTLADGSQRTVALLADELGLPGIGVDAGNTARSKALQRQVCQDAGLRVPRWARVASVADLDAFYADGPLSAVLKPSDSAAGSGVLRVETKAEAARHWPIVKSLSPSRVGVIEEFLDGREICVDAVVRGGEVLFVSSVDCEHMRTIGFLCTSSSYATVNPDVEPATALVRRIVSAVGVDTGAVHAEFKIGSDDVWTIVEVGLRPGGALVPELTVKVSGVDLYAAQALAALGESDPARPDCQVVAPFAQARYLVGEGNVQRFVPPADVLRDLPDVKVVRQQILPGQRARMPLSEAGRAGYAFGWGPDRIGLDTQLRTAIELLGTGMGITVRGNDPDDLMSSEHGPGPWWPRTQWEEQCD